jgi:antitoxin (DNA-binding transcriptional repressor) of toxin-antitoxin stability system
MPTTIVSMHQAKSSLSQLVKRAADGETIFIGSYGRAEAVLSAAANAKPKKRLGLLAGRLTIPDDFDAPLPREILAAFEGDAE